MIKKATSFGKASVPINKYSSDFITEFVIIGIILLKLAVYFLEYQSARSSALKSSRKLE